MLRPSEPSIAKESVEAGVGMFEFPLLSADRKVHNYLSQPESYDKVTEAIANVRFYKGTVAAVFVATEVNIDGFEEAAKLAIAAEELFLKANLAAKRMPTGEKKT